MDDRLRASVFESAMRAIATADMLGRSARFREVLVD
jgi:hypothetical protein